MSRERHPARAKLDESRPDQPHRSEKEITMRLRSPRTLAVAAAALVVLAGGATALAESGSSPSGSPTQAPRVARGLFVARAGVACGALGLKSPLGDPLKAAA